ncbi:hypothetical protein C8F04DRAFT_1174878 [Mycena alexandri]|uniref:Uncharacterized protein n=1 Tax=Mycena alexandri TaxID=1745969 RepID=A0AAD6TFY7_9AGAR|nr:hypothetical protein C8F04DRAFT_1174878 [Mycena alexandri]
MSELLIGGQRESAAKMPPLPPWRQLAAVLAALWRQFGGGTFGTKLAARWRQVCGGGNVGGNVGGSVAVAAKSAAILAALLAAMLAAVHGGSVTCWRHFSRLATAAVSERCTLAAVWRRSDGTYNSACGTSQRARGTVGGGGVMRRQCDRPAAKNAARVAATGGSWRHLGGTGGTFTVPLIGPPRRYKNEAGQ